jgi:hypothetical protein
MRHAEAAVMGLCDLADDRARRAGTRIIEPMSGWRERRCVNFACLGSAHNVFNVFALVMNRGAKLSRGSLVAVSQYVAATT